MGKEEFYKNKAYSQFYDIECPLCFTFLYQTFFEIYSRCTITGGFESRKNVTWQDIESYCHLRKLELSQYELTILLQIVRWADEKINELSKDD